MEGMVVSPGASEPTRASRRARARRSRGGRIIADFALRDTSVRRARGVEPVFASESGRGTHLSWALTPANWWVAREEAMLTGGGWGVCAEVPRSAGRAAVRNLRRAFPSREKHPSFRSAENVLRSVPNGTASGKWEAEKRSRVSNCFPGADV